MQAHDDEDAGANASTSPGPRRARTLIELGAAAAASLLAAFVLLRLWRAHLRVPFDYEDDALYFGMMVKAVADRGWFLTNPLLGAPGVLAMHDFPSADGMHLLFIKIMSWGSSDWALLFNAYFLLGFPLITMSALAVFRHFGVAYVPALAGSLLYAFLPSRLLTGEVHYFLTIFYEVPLAILLALWAAGPDPPLGWRRGRGRGGGRTWAAVALCALISGTGLYYAFFAGALIALGGIWGALRRRAPRNALAGLALAGVIVTGLGAQMAPTIVHQWRRGSNPEVAARQPQEAEVFGMRIAPLLLPAAGHRVPALRQLKHRYDAGAPFPAEGSATSLGVVGGVGFLVLLGALLLPFGRGHPRRELWRALAALNLLAVLIATTGGFGSLFALVVTPGIRGYARMHVFVGFLGLFAAVLLLERIARRSAPLGAAASALVLAIGLFDQVTPPAVREYDQVKALYDDDRALVHAVEASVPARAMIFELPYQRFPETAAQLNHGVSLAYLPLRPYFHSRSLRWSFPSMRGRSADAWTERVSALPAADLVRAVSDAGFDGILINRRAYSDGGTKIEGALAEALGPSAPRAAGTGLAFFNLVQHNRQALAGVPPEERARRRELAEHPLFLRWSDGFYPPEVGPEGPFRWSSGGAEIEIDNDARADRLATIRMRVLAGSPPLALSLGGDLLAEKATVGETGLEIVRTLRLGPGRHVLHMSAEGEPADAPRDPRRLLWRVENATLEELPGPPP